MQKKRADILVVDDEPLNVELLKAILQSHNYHVLEAANGAEALVILMDEKVDLVLLDVMMPVLDGFEVCRRIRADEKLRSLPVILITALRDTSERIIGIEAGCDDFVSKPFDKAELLARIKNMLRLHYFRAQTHEKEKFEHVINGMNDGLIFCDGNLEVLRSNQRGRDLLGFDLMAPSWLDTLFEKFICGRNGDLKGDLAGQDLDFRLEKRAAQGRAEQTLNFSSRLVKDPKGKALSVVIILQDITEEARVEHESRNFWEFV